MRLASSSRRGQAGSRFGHHTTWVKQTDAVLRIFFFNKYSVECRLRARSWAGNSAKIQVEPSFESNFHILPKRKWRVGLIPAYGSVFCARESMPLRSPSKSRRTGRHACGSSACGSSARARRRGIFTAPPRLSPPPAQRTRGFSHVRPVPP